MGVPQRATSPPMADPTDAVLVALRRIIRATDIYSQKLRKTVGLTTPQLLVLRAVARADDVTLGRVARDLSLSQATVTTLVDRLESGGFVTRARSDEDRRRVFVRLTSAGRDALSLAPDLLQDRFVRRFLQLEEWERSMITAALQRTAALMDAADLDAAPVLLVGDVVSRGMPD
jgi:DNA-binding MarR family transcriptional regulator